MTIRGRRRIDPKSSLRRLPPHLAKYQRKPTQANHNVTPVPPLPMWAKIIAVLGMLLFWLALLGWLPSIASSRQLDVGFKLFCLGQVPLLWCWMRRQARNLRRAAAKAEDDRLS